MSSEISDRLINQLNEAASDYYEAKLQEDEDKSDAILKDLGIDTMGFDTVGAGTGRIVFDMDILGYPNYVVKFAVPNPDYDGLQQNSREIELWETVNDEKGKFLAPIVEYGPDEYWLIMPKGEPVETIPYEWKKDAEYMLRDLIWKEDVQEENVVRIDGVLKICDYGVNN